MAEERTRAQRLAGLLSTQRKRHGWILVALAKKAGLSHTYLSKLEHAATGAIPPVETLAKLAYAYDLPLEELQAALETGAPMPPVAPRSVDELLEQARMVAPVAIPVVEHPAHAGHSGSPILDYVYASRPFAVNRDLVCVPVKGDCMAPDIRDGDQVIVDRDLSPRHGKVVLVVLNDEMWVRRYVEHNGEPVLRCDAPGYADVPLGQGEIVGVVVEIRRRRGGGRVRVAAGVGG